MESTVEQGEPGCLVVFHFGDVDDAAAVATDTNHDFFFESSSVFAASQNWVGVSSGGDAGRDTSAIDDLDRCVFCDVSFDSVTGPAGNFSY